MTSQARQKIMERAVLSGLPVVRAGRGAPEGFADATALFISGSNSPATKARLLLMACLMRFGSLPAAKDADNRLTPSARRSKKQTLLTSASSTRIEDSNPAPHGAHWSIKLWTIAPHSKEQPTREDAARCGTPELTYERVPDDMEILSRFSASSRRRDLNKSMVTF